MPKPLGWEPSLLCVIGGALDPSLQDKEAQKNTQPSDMEGLLAGGQYGLEPLGMGWELLQGIL